MPEQRLGPLLRVLAALTAPTFFPAEKIDHSVLPIANRQPEATAAYGAYLTTNCKAWHRDNLQGGPPLAPSFPPVPDITARGRVSKWTESEFTRSLRTGVTLMGINSTA